MGAPDPDNSKRVHGQLILNPTDLSAALSYGGTQLGSISAFYWIPGQRTVRLAAKEKGRTALMIHVEGDLTAGFVLREQSDDALSYAFPGTTDGASSKIVNFPTKTSGTELTGSKLLFAATNATENYSLLIYNAVVEFDATNRIRLSALKETTIPILVTGMEDGSGRIAKWGLLADLTL